MGKLLQMLMDEKDKCTYARQGMHMEKDIIKTVKLVLI